MASEPIECQVLVLRVSIHCEGCKKKVKKVLLHVDGVYRCDIDARSNKVMVTASRRIDATLLVAKLRKSGKQAEPWPEEPKQQQQPAESQSQETKNQSDEPPSKASEPASNPGPGNAEASAAAEPSNAQKPPPEPKKNADETPKPAHQESKAPSSAKASADTTPAAAAAAAAGQQSSTEAKGKAKQHQEEKPIDAKVTVEYDRGGYVNRVPAPQPVHVRSYHVARPTTSAAYYAAAPTPSPMPMPMPAPMARPGPSQGYIDEYSPPPYYNRSSPYEPYYYPQPSPYRYQNSSTDDYYYGAPQRSAFSPPRDAYGDMFNDENANSCSVM